MKTRLAVCVLTVVLTVAARAAQTFVYDLVDDFADLNITASAPFPAVPNVVTVTQNAGAVWTYQYENVANNHDGTYTMLPLGWNADYRGYGLASMNSSSYMAGSNVRTVVNATDDPNGIAPVPNPAACNYLKSWAGSGVGSIWEPLVIVWRAPQDGTVVVSITAQNTSANDANRRTNLSLDLWDGSTLAVLDSSPLLPGGSSDTLTATLAVVAGDQIHLWRDAYVTQQGVIAFSGIISLTIPEPASAMLLGLAGLVAMHRRRR